MLRSDLLLLWMVVVFEVECMILLILLLLRLMCLMVNVFLVVMFYWGLFLEFRMRGLVFDEVVNLRVFCILLS